MVDIQGPAQIVTDAYTRHQGFSQGLIAKAEALIDSLKNFSVDPITTNVDFEGPQTSFAPFELPEAPEEPLVDTELPELPQEPNVQNVAIPSFGDAPVFDAERPSVQFTDKPGALNVQDPGDVPQVTNPDIPASPALAIPDAPSLRDIDLPSVPTISLPSFTAVAPDLTIATPSAEFVYNEAPYSSSLLDSVKEKIRALFEDGGFGIPPAIEQALFDRARVREDRTARKAVQEAAEEFSSRGFSIPSGELARRLGEIRQTNRDAVSQLVRDILIRATDVEIENMRLGVQQGVALENILIQQHHQISERALRAAELASRLAIELFNAQITLFNARIQAFNVRVEEFKARVQAELSKLELYKSRLEASKLIGEINEQDVRVYAERVRALLATVEIYRAQIEAVKAQVEANKTVIEGYRAKVEGYTARVQAKRSEFEAWAEEVRAEVAKYGLFQAESEVFANRVRAYAAGVTAKLDPLRLQIDANRQTVEQYQSRLQAVRELVNAKSQAAQTQSALFDAKSRLYATNISAAEAKSRADDRRFALGVEEAKARVDTALQNVRNAIENSNRAAQLTLQAILGAAQVLAQLSAGALSAVNLSAGISGSSSDTRDVGKSVSHNVSYEAEEGATPPEIF